MCVLRHNHNIAQKAGVFASLKTFHTRHCGKYSNTNRKWHFDFASQFSFCVHTLRCCFSLFFHLQKVHRRLPMGLHHFSAKSWKLTLMQLNNNNVNSIFGTSSANFSMRINYKRTHYTLWFVIETDAQTLTRSLTHMHMKWFRVFREMRIVIISYCFRALMHTSEWVGFDSVFLFLLSPFPLFIYYLSLCSFVHCIQCRNT